ncbi:serine/threonine-protein kinase [Stigmatella hybrida]|uniref:serine/threonine-protein kinase n=1 Tax=Stigmatella hybrida TaxID=394097 RepID=UPI001CDAE3B7|nr:serine/threonine-protein kinase [Stigmatella hybrida]
MDRPSNVALHPALLPPGTVVGSWRVVAWAGRGIHGAVYRVVPVDPEGAPPLALKLALMPRDPRFAREAELLSRLRHPHIPRLWEDGEWQHPSGTLYPFLVMDWVEGTPLYDWAQQHPPSSQQVLRLLAQLARALQALHAQGCVHRDIKGDNMLVRHADGHALLTDFGSGRYPQASTLTQDTLPPGTPAYRSPEACLFDLQFFRDPQARYSAGPTDDIYALGVTAYRLVTGKYPELAEPFKDDAGLWHLEGVASPAPGVLNPRVSPQLNAVILRMLSVHPPERGTTQALAEAMEQAAEILPPENSQRLFAQETKPQPAQEIAFKEKSPKAAGSQLPPRHWRTRLATTAMLVALGSWAGWFAHGTSQPSSNAVRREAAADDAKDKFPSGLGDVAASTSPVPAPTSSLQVTLAEDNPPTPVPGQMRPDAKGRCLHKRHVALNGGCWVELERENCEALNVPHKTNKGTCYVPVFSPQRLPTSVPATQP